MPNLWRQFQELLPASPLLIGSIVARHGDGSATVALLDGGQLHVTGSGAVGDRVFVRDGEITGAAPELPLVDIEV